jgi:hypothetical protein
VAAVATAAVAGAAALRPARAATRADASGCACAGRTSGEEVATCCGDHGDPLSVAGCGDTTCAWLRLLASTAGCFALMLLPWRVDGPVATSMALKAGAPGESNIDECTAIGSAIAAKKGAGAETPPTTGAAAAAT